MRLLLLLISLLGSACVVVRAHEREHLAHPAMAESVWPQLERADQHTLEVRQGTGGATTRGGGGCGCN